jgi:hypothetical protein
MPWAAGVYTRGYPSWSNDAASNLPISATKFDTEDNDFAAGLNNCLTKDGLSIPNAPMTWGLSNGQVLNLTRGSDGVVLGIARTGGSNNPALQAIVQDSTGVGFGFSGSVYVNFLQAGGVTFSQPVAFAASSGVSAAFAGLANQNTITVTGSSTSGQSFGEFISAGTTSADYAFLVRNIPGQNLFQLKGDGSGALGPTSSLGLSWNAAGAMSIAAPSSGNALTVNGTGGTTASFINGSTVLLFQGTGAGNTGFGTNSAHDFTIVSGGTNRTTWSISGSVTFAAPTSGAGITVTGPNGNYAERVFGANSASNSFGLQVIAGTNTSDVCALFNNAANSLNYFLIYGDGGAALGAPTGGSQGIGTLNATGLLINGVNVYAGIPNNGQNAGTYQFVLTDNGKAVVFTNTTATWTIPANASVAFPIGAVITLVNGGSGAITLAITSDTLTWYKGGSFANGTRTIAAESVVTILKITSTTWVLTGNGIS